MLCVENFGLSYNVWFSQIQLQMFVCSTLHLAQHGALTRLFDGSLLFKFLEIIVINLSTKVYAYHYFCSETYFIWKLWYPKYLTVYQNSFYTYGTC